VHIKVIAKGNLRMTAEPTPKNTKVARLNQFKTNKAWVAEK